MGSPSSPPLTVEESDGTNSNRPVTDLKFNAADFTIAASGRSSTVSLSGGGSGASLTDTYVGFGDASNLLTGSANFVFISATSRLGIGTPTPSTPLHIESSDNDLALFKSTDTNAGITIDTPNDGYAVVFFSEDSVNKWSLGKLASGSDKFTIYDEVNTTPRLTIADTGRVGIGTTNPATTLHVVGIATIGETSAVGATNFAALSVNGSTSLATFRASNTSSGDQVGGIRVFSDNFRSRGMMIGAFDVTSGTETEQYLFGTQYAKSGSAGISASPENGGTEYITCYGLGASGSSVAINDDNINMDFKVGAETSGHLIWADAGRDAVGILGQPADDVSLHVFDNDNQATVVRIESNDTDTSSSPILELRNSRAYDPAITTASVGLIKFSADTVNGMETVGSIALAQDSVSSFDSTSMQFKVKRSGVEVDNFRIRYSEVVVNEGSTDCDFRVETNGNTHGFHVDAATDIVGVGSIGVAGLADNNPKLQVNGSISGKVPIINTASGTTTITLATNQIQGQVLYFEDTGAITINLPDCVTGDNIKIFKPSGNLTIATSGSNTINGALSVTRNSSATNALIEVIAVKNNTYIVDNPTR